MPLALLQGAGSQPGQRGERRLRDNDAGAESGGPRPGRRQPPGCGHSGPQQGHDRPASAQSSPERGIYALEAGYNLGVHIIIT
ncbi:hypothetical protein FOCC_FOCC009521 [Frankliniella occidentalis]|nr:hypothetical protein FOCC_FOCC009521 [Frankliniella occidentalis]